MQSTYEQHLGEHFNHEEFDNVDKNSSSRIQARRERNSASPVPTLAPGKHDQRQQRPNIATPVSQPQLPS